MVMIMVMVRVKASVADEEGGVPQSVIRVFD